MVNSQLNDRFAASIVNAIAPYMFSTSAVGFVLSAADSSASQSRTTGGLQIDDLWCSYPLDGNSMGQDHHGCGQGSYMTLSKMLTAQQRMMRYTGRCVWGEIDAADRSGCRYNELVIKGDRYAQLLPSVIEAIFYPINAEVKHPEGGPEDARKLRAAFISHFYPRGGNRLPPLLAYDVAEAQAGRAPFRPAG